MFIKQTGLRCHPMLSLFNGPAEGRRSCRESHNHLRDDAGRLGAFNKQRTLYALQRMGEILHASSQEPQQEGRIASARRTTSLSPAPTEIPFS